MIALLLATAPASGPDRWWNYPGMVLLPSVIQPWRELLLHVEVIGRAAPTRDGHPVLLTRVVVPYVGRVSTGVIEVVVPIDDPPHLGPGVRLLVAGRAEPRDDGHLLLVPVRPEVDLQRLEAFTVADRGAPANPIMSRAATSGPASGIQATCSPNPRLGSPARSAPPTRCT
jgi:hypothetical protein